MAGKLNNPHPTNETMPYCIGGTERILRSASLVSYFQDQKMSRLGGNVTTGSAFLVDLLLVICFGLILPRSKSELPFSLVEM
jgi:hypothetical protein